MAATKTSGRRQVMSALARPTGGFKTATGVTLDYIGFDACLIMATLEVAKVVQPYARYLGASQEQTGLGLGLEESVETAAPTRSSPAGVRPDRGARPSTTSNCVARGQPDSTAVGLRDQHRSSLPPPWNGWSSGQAHTTATSANANGGILAARSPRRCPAPRPWLAPAHRAMPPPPARWKRVAITRCRTTTFSWTPRTP